MPSLFVVVLISVPVAIFFATTLAPAKAAPPESVTTPRKPPVADCAKAVNEQQNRIAAPIKIEATTPDFIPLEFNIHSSRISVDWRMIWFVAAREPEPHP